MHRRVRFLLARAIVGMVLIEAAHAASPGSAAAQRSPELYILPTVQRGVPDSARSLVARLPERIETTLRRAGARISVSTPTPSDLTYAGVRVDSLVPGLAARLGKVPRGGSARRDYVASDSAARDTLTTERFLLVLEVSFQPRPPGNESQRRDRLHARLTVFTDSLAAALSDTATFTVDGVHDVVDRIADRVTLRLTKNIRIAIIDFGFTGSQYSTTDSTYGRGIARLLGTKLSASPRVLLLDYGDSTVERARQRARSTAPGYTDPLTVVNLGRELLANYLVFGDVWAVGDAVRIDVRCVSVDSRLTIASRGVTIDRVSIRSIESQLATIAGDLLTAIESDLARQATRARFVAVTAVAPVPNTVENRSVALGVARSLQRKIALVGDTRWVPRLHYADSALLRSGQEARWDVAASLEADVLVEVRIDRLERDEPFFDVTFFDTDRPVATRSVPMVGSMDDVDGVLEQIVVEVFKFLGASLDNTARRRMAKAPYKSPQETVWIDLAGGLAAQSNSRAFLGAAGSLVIRVGPAVLHGKGRRYLWEPIGLRAHLWGMRNARVGDGRQYVSGFDLYTGQNLRLRPYRSNTPFVGGHLMLSGLVRHAHSETQIDGQPGGGVVLGWETTLTSGRQIRYRLELKSTFRPLGDKVLDQENFRGGRLSAAMLTISTNR